MTPIAPTVRFMAPEESRNRKLLNAGSVIEFEGTTIPIAAGRSDQVHVFTESTVLFVLGINYRNEYIGLEVFDSGSGEEYDSIFINYEWELKKYLGDKWRELEPITILRRFMKLMI